MTKTLTREELLGLPDALDVRALTFPAAEQPTGQQGVEIDEGFSFIQIPPGLFDADLRIFVERIVRAVYWTEAAWHPLIGAAYRTLSRLADQGITVSAPAFGLGFALAVAKVKGVKIPTHPRDLAKDAQTRYTTLLKVRAAALAELQPIKGESAALGTEPADFG